MPSTALSGEEIKARITACNRARQQALIGGDLSVWDAKTEEIDQLLEQLPH